MVSYNKSLTKNMILPPELNNKILEYANPPKISNYMYKKMCRFTKFIQKKAMEKFTYRTYNEESDKAETLIQMIWDRYDNNEIYNRFINMFIRERTIRNVPQNKMKFQKFYKCYLIGREKVWTIVPYRNYV